MWIQVRTMDGKISSRIDDLSKLTKIEDLRKLLVDKFDAPVERQRLFHRGKQLEDGHTLFDYSVGLNDIVQIIVREADTIKNSPKKLEATPTKILNKENKSEVTPSSTNTSQDQVLSKYYKVGDRVDAKDKSYGAWFEARITSITPSTSEKDISHCTNQDNNKSPNETQDDGFIYTVVFEDYEEEEGPVDLKFNFIRPRARKILKCNDLQIGDVIMVNYNMTKPEERGFWYDCKITSFKQSEKSNYIIGTLIGVDGAEFENCKICFTDEVQAIENPIPITEQNGNYNFNKTYNCNQNEELISSSKAPKCTYCKDIPTRKCKKCSCCVCGGKESPEKQLMCDECDDAFHLWCIKPPLKEIPKEDEWYCPNCKNDETEVVRAGEKLKASKKKSKMASAKGTTSRDWGKGMACVGRTKECTIVPPNHFGPIPGVEVGTMWLYRVQVSESGVHRPHVAGIHGREKEGAYSIVLSGGYEDDLDEGDVFKYTGSGGRDLSGNKRSADQSSDQKLTRMNKALALNCKAKLSNNGAEATEWQKGKPVRVVRNAKGSKHSEYCPKEGNRYDGIYKVVKYWQEKGKSGFLVWRYLLKRDDPQPAPWTKAGQKRSEELGLTMQYPEGYLQKKSETDKTKGSESDKESSESDKEIETDKTKNKRVHGDKNSESNKKRKTMFTVSSKAQQFIDEDAKNQKLWKECLAVVSEGSQIFLKKVEEIFSCICCQDVVFDPITTDCFHNICKSCLVRSFKAQVYSCPMCRQELNRNIIQNRNQPLQSALLVLFPGYDAGR